MKFKEFLIEEETPGLTPMDKENAIDYIAEHCSEFLKENVMLWRGIKYTDEPYLLSEPLKRDSERRSLTGMQFALTAVAGLPNWKPFPNRKKSQFMTTNRYAADRFGRTYVCFPQDTAKFGLAPDKDFNFTGLWGTGILSHRVSNLDLHWILEAIIASFTKWKNQLYHVESYGILVNALNETYSKLGDGKIEFNSDTLSRSWAEVETYQSYDSFVEDVKATIEFAKKEQSLLKAVEKLMDPHVAGFKVLGVSDMRNIDDDVEVWTEAPCVLISWARYAEIWEALHDRGLVKHR